VVKPAKEAAALITALMNSFLNQDTPIKTAAYLEPTPATD